MFLDAVKKRNKSLIKTAYNFHKRGLIEPDTYILDFDTIKENAKKIKEEADRYNINLYFMTKQFGRNPLIAKELQSIGYQGAVTVDYREAEILYENGIYIGHVGHLVQPPSSLIEKILNYKPEIITVYSVEKAKEISDMAFKLGINQNIMLRVIDKKDTLYDGQYGGFYIDELIDKVMQIIKLPNISIHGVTSFPCFLYNEETKKICETNNIYTIQLAKELIEKNFNIKLKQINTPSATCTSNIKRLAELGGTHGEPGHGLTGTTPLHAVSEQPEIPAIVYVSEISHNLDNYSFCYGGGHYRRSHIKKALCINKNFDFKEMKIEQPDDSSIDYYIKLKGNCEVGTTVVMSYRTQIFVTRSKVVVVSGIKEGKPEILGIYDSQGRLLG